MNAVAAGDGLDARRTVTLVVVLASVVITVLDLTILNVALPTILEEFDTDLTKLQWVVTGYALTFATLLVIGGKLGDHYGHRRMFIIGVSLFGIGSLIAALSNGVAMLVLGEAVIEGTGAALMTPATLAILSTTFQGHQRATAFAAWGAVAGASGSFGPIIGGFLTTNASWRWSFGINVIVAPLAVLGAVLFMRKDEVPAVRPRLDVVGALLIGAALFVLVLGLSEGGRYGWLKPREELVLADRVVWPATAPVSFVPVLVALSALLLFGFYVVERRREAAAADPLFEFSLMHHKGYRYGLITMVVLAMGQLSFIFVIPLVLQQGQHLTAARIGWWLLPTGLSIVLGAQVGGRSTRRFGPTTVVFVGLVLEAVGLTYVALALVPDVHFLRLLPGFIGYGFGIGLATSQLTSVVLHDVPHHRAGVASGASSTLGQVGGALGVAVTASILSAQTIRVTVDQLLAAPLAAPVQNQAIEQVRAAGVGYVPPTNLPASTTATLESAFQHGLVTGAKPAMLFGTGVVVIGALLSLLIPRMPALPRRAPVREVIPAETPVA